MVRRVLAWLAAAMVLASLLVTAAYWLEPALDASDPAAFETSSPRRSPLREWPPTPQPPRLATTTDVAGSSDRPPREPKLADLAFAHPALLLELAGAHTEVAGGRFIGFRTALTEATDFTDLVGLEPGDLITGVNGIAFSGEDQAIALLDDLSGHGHLTYTVERNGRTVVLN
jgi:general secretion pathway protein C